MQYTKAEHKIFNSETNSFAHSLGERFGLDLDKTPSSYWERGKLFLTYQYNYRYRKYIIDDIPSDINALSVESGFLFKFTSVFSGYLGAGYSWVSNIPVPYFAEYNDYFIQEGYFVNKWELADPNNQINSTENKAFILTQYELNTKEFLPTIISINWSFKDNSTVVFLSRYDWHQGFEYASLLSSYYFGVNSWNINCSYNFIENAWLSKEFYLQLSQPIYKSWALNINFQYDALFDTFSVGKVSLTSGRDYPIFQISYDVVLQEYSVQYILKKQRK